MLPVHFDLFLYVMRERNNRLFLREFKVDVRLFLTLQWNQGGEGVLPGEFGLCRTREPVQVRGMLCLLRAESLKERAGIMRKTSSRDIRV